MGSGVTEHESTRVLSFFPLCALMYFTVSGGAYGLERLIQAGGAFYTVAGTLIFALAWSLPIGLVTSELSSAFPVTGGFVAYVDAAFGHTTSFIVAFVSTICALFDVTLFPILLVSYLQHTFPACPYYALLTLRFTLIFIAFVMNYRGILLVGRTASVMIVVGTLPLIIFSVVCAFHMSPNANFFATPPVIAWPVLLNFLFWNMNAWDQVSFLAGTVKDPETIFHPAVFSALGIVVVMTAVPLAFGAMVATDTTLWTNGYLSTVAGMAGGPALTVILGIGYVAFLFSCHFSETATLGWRIHGFSELRLIPRVFSTLHPNFQSPYINFFILLITVSALSFVDFEVLLPVDNVLYAFNIVFQFAAAVVLRIKQPDLPRPYTVPVGTVGLVLFLIPPVAVCGMLVVLADWVTLAIAVSIILFSLVFWQGMQMAKQHGWFVFVESPEERPLLE